MNIEQESKKPIFKTSLLVISLFIMMSAVISPALPLMEKAFPNVPRVTVELLTTIPNFGQILGLLINPWLVRKIGPKKVIILGLATIGIAGTLPVFLNNFLAIFISRIILGIGVGVYNSLAVSLIMLIYKNDTSTLNQLLGYQNIMNDAGYIISALAICYLVTISWHDVFWVYIMAIPVLFMFAHFVKVGKSQHIKSKISFSSKNLKEQFNPTIILIGILTLLIYIFYMALVYKLPSFVIDVKLGNESTVSLILAIVGFVGVLVGLIFGWLYKRIKKWIWPICLILNAIGFYLISISTSFISLIIGSIILGLGFGLVMPYIFKWIDLSSDPKWVNLDTTFCLIMMDLGCTLSPFIISLIDKSAKGALTSSAVFFAIIAALGIIHALRRK